MRFQVDRLDQARFESLGVCWLHLPLHTNRSNTISQFEIVNSYDRGGKNYEVQNTPPDNVYYQVRWLLIVRNFLGNWG